MRWLFVFVLGGCATLADAGGGDENAPNANAGPFRELRPGELGNGHTAPYALRDAASFVRDVSVLDDDGDPTTFGVTAFAARRVSADTVSPDPSSITNELVSFKASDARSFELTPHFLLRADSEGEGGWLGAPSAVRSSDGIWLYYAAADGIRLAHSPTGEAFTRDSVNPVLAVAKTGWEKGSVPASPSVLRLPDGSWRMFYEVKGALGEARSSDGRTWLRGPAPVLQAAAGAGPLAAPCAVSSRSPLGRDRLWLYHSAVASDGHRAIEVATSDGFDGAYARALAPVFGRGADLEPTEPSVLRFAEFSLIFVTEQAGKSKALAYPAVAVGVAPATFGALP